MLSKELIQKMYNAFHDELPVFNAFSDDERLKMFLRILQNGKIGIHVNDLTSLTHLSRPAVSHHLKVLKDCGLIDFYKQGTKVFYFIPSDENLSKLQKNLEILQKGFLEVNMEELQENSVALVQIIENVKK